MFYFVQNENCWDRQNPFSSKINPLEKQNLPLYKQQQPLERILLEGEQYFRFAGYKLAMSQFKGNCYSTGATRTGKSISMIDSIDSIIESIAAPGSTKNRALISRWTK